MRSSKSIHWLLGSMVASSCALSSGNGGKDSSYQTAMGRGDEGNPPMSVASTVVMPMDASTVAGAVPDDLRSTGTGGDVSRTQDLLALFSEQITKMRREMQEMTLARQTEEKRRENEQAERAAKAKRLEEERAKREEEQAAEMKRLKEQLAQQQAAQAAQAEKDRLAREKQAAKVKKLQQQLAQQTLEAKQREEDQKRLEEKQAAEVADLRRQLVRQQAVQAARAEKDRLAREKQAAKVKKLQQQTLEAKQREEDQKVLAENLGPRSTLTLSKCDTTTPFLTPSSQGVFRLQGMESGHLYRIAIQLEEKEAHPDLCPNIILSSCLTTETEKVVDNVVHIKVTGPTVTLRVATKGMRLMLTILSKDLAETREARKRQGLGDKIADGLDKLFGF